MKIEDFKFEGQHLALMPGKLSEIIAARQEVQASDIEIEAAINRRATKFKDVKGQVVVVPLGGYISHKPTIWSALGFESSSETFANWIQDLVNNPDVGAIVIDVDSPGGTVLGLQAATDKIYNLRGQKPIIAVVNDLMASAAYFIGSAADEIVADPDAMTGSIGTILIHLDYSKYLELNGIKPTIIKQGQFKAEANPYEPLTEDAKNHLQQLTSEYYETFVAAVARNRKTTAAKVKSEFGQGMVFSSGRAKEIGMIDRIATMEQVIRDLQQQPKGKSKKNAQNKLKLLEIS